MDISKYKNKNVLVTGHTGFKGTWLCKMLIQFGAKVTGYSLEPPMDLDFFEQSGIENQMESIFADIRNLDDLHQVFREQKPEYVFHLAAQPIVRESYKNPVLTFETNVMGTVNLLECIRNSETVHSFLNVTTDKVYCNYEQDRGYVETDELNGFDPYSNSKSCSELVTSSYVNSFLREKGVAVSTCRAGNVIGGGDYAKDRIIPDCIRAAKNHTPVVVRNPEAVRPYQHVLEPLYAYLKIALEQSTDKKYAGAYNVGPQEHNCVTTAALVTMFCNAWGNGLKWVNQSDGGPRESVCLKLDCGKIKDTFGWNPVWKIEEAVNKIVEFEKYKIAGGQVKDCMEKQIQDYFNLIRGI